MEKEIEIKTFGCKLNHYDSLLMQKHLKGLSSSKDIFVLNSCAVTAQAGKEIRRTAKKIKHSKPESVVVLAGCGAQVETDLYKQSPAIDLVVGNSDRAQLKNILKDFLSEKENKQKVFKSNIFHQSEVYSDFISSHPDRTRAFLKIQDGCDSFCTFCIIPFARGKSRSLPLSFLVESVRKLSDQNIKEVVLTGVHIGDYQDGESSLEDLVAQLLKDTCIPRIRLTSLEPIEISPRLLDLFEDDRMCLHFHISLQSANSKVLKSMKRKYSAKEVELSFERIAKKFPQAFVGMDVIAGFPTESLQDFEESYQLLKNHSWTNMHVFPYSQRKGTYSAFKYKPLDQKEVSKRASLLRELSSFRFDECLKAQVGCHKKALLFKKDNTKALSRDYWKIKLPSSNFEGEKEVIINDISQEKGLLIGDWA